MAEEFESAIPQETEKLDLSGTWRDLLALFGTEQARDNFRELCQRYYACLVRAKADADNALGSEYSARKGESSDKTRAAIHNEIMSTIYRLLSQLRLDLEKQKKFNVLTDRKVVAEMINQIYGYQGKTNKNGRGTELGRMREGKFY